MQPVSLSGPAVSVSVSQQDGVALVTLDDHVNKRRLEPVPLCSALVYEKMERRYVPIHEFRVDKVARQGDEIVAQLGHEYYEFCFALRLSVDSEGLRLRFDPVEWYNTKPDTFRLMQVDCLWGLMQTGPGGQMILPFQSGMRANLRGKPTDARFMIYGEQAQWELLPTMPLVVTHGPAGGMLALIAEGACEAEARAASDGQGGGKVGVSFVLQRVWPDTPDPRSREIRYVPIPATADPVLFAGRRLRRFVTEAMHKPTLAERATESPEVAYLLEAYIMKLFHGMQPLGHMAGAKDGLTSRETFHATLTFDEAATGLRRLKRAGVEKVLTQSVGWNPRGHDGMWPSRFPIEPRVGGEAGFRRLVDVGRELGYHVNVHDNYLSQYRSSPLFDLDTVMYDQWGNPDLRGFWGGGETYVTWPPCLCRDTSRIEEPMRKVQSLGVRGMFYLDGMGNPLEGNYHPKYAGSRTDYADGVVELLERAKAIFGSVGTECGFLYNVSPVDVIVQCGNEYQREHWREDWPIMALRGPSVPIWQLAMHGLVMREAGTQTWAGAMQCVLYGDHPRDEWSARPVYMPELTDDRVAALAAGYDLCLRRFGYLQTLEMTGYQNENSVEQTSFEDGTVVCVDHAAGELIVNNERVERPTHLFDIDPGRQS